MTVREARAATDMPQLLALLRAALQRSTLAGIEGGDIDESVAKRLIMAAIMRHGRHGPGGFLALVSESDERIHGLLIAAMEPVHVIGNRLYATDLFFICEPEVDPRDPLRMATQLRDWARAAPDCVMLKVGVTNELGTDPERAGRIWARLGCDRIGEIYEMRV